MKSRCRRCVRELPFITNYRHWYADDATAWTLTSLRGWWDRLHVLCPQFSYRPNPSKTWLLVKPNNAQTAEECFQHTGIKITTQGARILGAALGVRPFVEKFVCDRVASWVTKVKNFSVIAKTHSQASYAVFSHSLSSK